MSSTSEGRPPKGWVSLRRIAVALARTLPASWRLRLRRGYFSASPGTPGHRWRRKVLDVVRLGGIPQTGPFPVPDRPDVRMVPSDSYITTHLFWLGLDSYEPGEPAWWSSLVSVHASTLELGANVGLYTILGARAGEGRPYVAVEANPRSAAILRKNLSLNDLGHVRVVEAAVVGDPDAHVVTLCFPDRDPYEASAGAFVAGAPDRSIAASRTVSVPAVVPDDLVDGVDLLKLDIEGLEVDVLGRIRTWIVEHRPTIVVEARDDATHLRAFVADLVEQAGYGCVAVTDGRPRHLDDAEALGGRLQTIHATRDLTLVPRERVDALVAM